MKKTGKRLADSGAPQGAPKKGRKKKSRLQIFFLTILCIGVIFLGTAAYLSLSGSIRPMDLASDAPGPADTGFLDEEEAPPADGGGDGVLGGKTPAGRREGVYTIVLAGTDMDDYHTDTLMVAALDTVNGTLKVLNIPRDTQVVVKRSTKKINAAWGVGGGAKGEGAAQLKKELKTVIGFTPDAYAVVDLKGFVKLVNALDGVEFDVPRNMNYDDPDQNLHIHLQKGLQTLDGEKALQLVRFRRYPEGDIKRVEVQQDFLKAVFKQTLSLKNVFKISDFAAIASEHLRSDLDLGQMIWFGKEIMKLGEGSVSFHTLPGDTNASYQKQSYVIVDTAEALALINETINPYIKPITEENVNHSSLRG